MAAVIPCTKRKPLAKMRPADLQKILTYATRKRRSQKTIFSCV
jgi:hypothetical protein